MVTYYIKRVTTFRTHSIYILVDIFEDLMSTIYMSTIDARVAGVRIPPPGHINQVWRGNSLTSLPLRQRGVFLLN